MWSPNLRGGSDSPLLNSFPFAGSIEDEANYYRLHVDGFSGTVEDSFAWYHNKRSFSTPDSGNICAEISHGGWWYHQCFFSNLNGVYYKVKGGKGTWGSTQGLGTGSSRPCNPSWLGQPLLLEQGSRECWHRGSPALSVPGIRQKHQATSSRCFLGPFGGDSCGLRCHLLWEHLKYVELCVPFPPCRCGV